MKIIIIILILITINAFGVTHPPKTTQTVGSQIRWFDDSVKPADGFVIFYGNSQAELGTAAEKEFGLADVNIIKDPVLADTFTYKATDNALFNNKNICLQVVAYFNITEADSSISRLDSARTPAVCTLIAERPATPKNVQVQ